MKLSTKNLLIIFGIVILIFGIAQFTKRDNRSPSLRSELVNIDTANVTEVKITSGKGEVTLSKADEWQVSVGEDRKQTREGVVVGLLNNLNTIKPSRLAANSKESWEEYQVTDSAGTRVQVYAGNSLLSDLIIGKFGVEGQRSFYTYVRMIEDENVYVADGFMGMNINADPSSYRNNAVLRLQKDSLLTVTFDYPDSAFILTKREGWFLNDQPADSAAVVQFLQDLAYLNSTGFYDQEIISPRTHQLKFSFTGQEDIVVDMFYENGDYRVRSSENGEETFLDPAISEKLLKSQNDFIPTDI